MGKYLDRKCRLCRREGTKLFLKGERCLGPKCPIERKGAVSPGMQGTRRRRTRLSEYALQLREKQKMKRFYALQERQFRNYFQKAKKLGGATGSTLVQMLEGRLDNIVYRLGFVSSRLQARQIISHGHILVDGKRVDIPSFQVKVGQVITLTSASLKMPAVLEALGKKEIELPDWLERKAAVGRVKRLVSRPEVEADINEQAVIEFYSR